MRLLLLALVITLCSCATTSDEKLRIVCQSATTTMNIVTAGVKAGKVSRADQDKAIKAGEALQPICTKGGQP